MDFDLSEEQRLLKESVGGLLGSSYEFEQRKKYMAEKGGWSKSAWNKLAEQGLLGLPFSEDDGGFGASSPNRACSACRSPKTTAASVPARSKP